MPLISMRLTVEILKPATPVVNGRTRPDGGKGHFAQKHFKSEPAPALLLPIPG